MQKQKSRKYYNHYRRDRDWLERSNHCAAGYTRTMVFVSVILTGLLSALAGSREPVLARIDISGPVTGITLPVHAQLRDLAGQEYLLVCAEIGQLALTGLKYQVLDTAAVPENYVLARQMAVGTGRADAAAFRIVHDDGCQLIIHAPGQEADALADQGFALARLPHDPVRWTRPGTGLLVLGDRDVGTQGLTYDPMVADMLGRIGTNRLATLMRRITGGEPEVAGGNLLTIASRYTYSGAPIDHATRLAYEHFQALGLNVQFHAWSYGLNVVGTLPGVTRTNEIVLIVAHLDNMPSGPIASGADDNGSGVASVLLSAEVLRQFQFQRTIRFLLVTGEEQGLLGSAAYASMASAASNNIVAVISMDMIAWDSNHDGHLALYTRSTTKPGYAGDLVIATTFTNVAAKYSMVTPLVPQIIPDSSMVYSDHSSFWNKGYSAVLAIEDYPRDVNPYYHSTNDTLQNFNMPYCASFVRACLGTVAHLAIPVTNTPLDIVEVASAAEKPGDGIGASAFYARHENLATEAGSDRLDQAWAEAPANTNASWLKIGTQPYGTALRMDTRPSGSETIFTGNLSVVTTKTVPVACTNRLRFDFLSSPQSNRLYFARIHIPGAYTVTFHDFDCVTNLRSVVDSGGYLDLPVLVNTSNGVPYGTCEIAARFLNTGATNCCLRIADMAASQIVFSASVQLGVQPKDQIEVNSNLLKTNGWQQLTPTINAISLTDDSFESGWTTETLGIESASLTNSRSFYFRLKRLWQDL